MIEINQVTCGDLIKIDTISTMHENDELGMVTTEGGYYPICFVYEEDEQLWTIGLRLDNDDVLYIPSDQEDVIKDYIKKY